MSWKKQPPRGTLGRRDMGAGFLSRYTGFFSSSSLSSFVFCLPVALVDLLSGHSLRMRQGLRTFGESGTGRQFRRARAIRRSRQGYIPTYLHVITRVAGQSPIAHRHYVEDLCMPSSTPGDDCVCEACRQPQLQSARRKGRAVERRANLEACGIRWDTTLSRVPIGIGACKVVTRVIL